MAAMKQGTHIGRMDFHGQEICVGDTLRSKVTGTIYTVNKYGQPVDEHGNKPAVFRGSEFEIYSSSEDGSELAIALEDFSPVQEAVSITENVDYELIDDVRPDMDMRFRGISSQELADELRQRGYTVTASKTVTIDL